MSRRRTGVAALNVKLNEAAWLARPWLLGSSRSRGPHVRRGSRLAKSPMRGEEAVNAVNGSTSPRTKPRDWRDGRGLPDPAAAVEGWGNVVDAGRSHDVSSGGLEKRRRGRGNEVRVWGR